MFDPLFLTRYRNIFLLLLLVASMANSVSVFAQQKADLQPGRLRIKVSPEFAVQLRQARARTARVGKDDVMLFGIQSLDAVHRRFKVNNLQRVFRDAGIFEAKHRKYGLDRWYEISMDSTQSMEDASTAFGSIEQIEKVEPLHRKHLNDSGPNGFKVVAVDEPTTVGINANGPNDPLLSKQWHYNNTGQTGGRVGADIHVLNAWQLETGKPEVVVAVMDGGIQYDHPDLAANMWINTNEIPGNALDDDNNGYVDDVHGYGFGDDVGDMAPDLHGTHVGGTIAAVTNNGVGVAGVAGGSGNGDGVRLMSCAVFGNVTVDHFPESYVYAADMGAVISQNSWGYNFGYEQVVLDAIDYFIAEAGKDVNGNQVGVMNGGTVIFAAGNNSKDLDAWPGMYKAVLAVASTTHEDLRARYSNYGSWVDLAAPGGFNEIVNDQGVLSTFPLNQYGYLEGTSMACPHVSGVAALLVSKFGGVGYDHTQLEQRLVSTTDNIDALNPNFSKQLGSGRLNATKALYMPGAAAPQAIEDLTITWVTHESLTITWTSPFDDNDFPVAAYDLRYSTSPITLANFELATPVSTIPASTQQGDLESFVVGGLHPLTTYYIAMKSIDSQGHVSDISNQVYQETYYPPVLFASSYTFDGHVQTNGVDSTILTLKNFGEARLKFAFAYTGEPRFVSVSPLQGEVTSDDSVTVTITFSGENLSAGTYTDEIVLTTNDLEHPDTTIVVTLHVQGNGAPILKALPGALNFEPTQVSTSTTREITLSNKGSENLVIDSIYVDDAPFAVNPMNAKPLVLEAFQTVSVVVSFNPVAIGNFQGTLTIVSSDAASPILAVPLDGEGNDSLGGISVIPRALSQMLDVGESAAQTLHIRNSNAVPVSIVVETKNDFYNTPLPGIESTSILEEKAAAIREAAIFSINSPRYLTGMEKFYHAEAAASAPTLNTPSFQYATDFENLIVGPILGNGGWVGHSTWTVSSAHPASGEKHLRYTPLPDFSAYAFSPRVFGGSETKSSFTSRVNLGPGAAPSMYLIAGSITTGLVITRILIQDRHSVSVLVMDSPASGHYELVPVTLPGGYFDISLEVVRATNEFSLFVEGKKVYTAMGFTGTIEQIGFLGMGDSPLDVDDVRIIDGDVKGIPYITVSPVTTIIPAHDSISVSVNFDAAHLPFGTYESSIVVQPSDWQATKIPVVLSVLGGAKISSKGPIEVYTTTGIDTTAQIVLANTGGTILTYSLTISPSADSAWITVNPVTGVIPLAGYAYVTAIIDASALSPGDYTTMLHVMSEASSLQIPISVHVASPPHIELQAEPLMFESDKYPDYRYLLTNNTGGSELTYKIESSTSLRVFPHTVLTPTNTDPVHSGLNTIEAISNAALPFIGESYDDQFERFLGIGNMNGVDGWVADGNEWFVRIPYEYGHVIQGKSTGSGTLSQMFSPLVDQGSETIASCRMRVNFQGSKGTTWQFVPQSPSSGQVITRFQVNPDQSIQVLVRGTDGTASFQHIRATIPAQYFDLLFKVDRVTGRFAIFFDTQKVFVGQGFGNHLEQMGFLSLMEKAGSSIFIKTYEHYNCSSMIETGEDWYFTNETVGSVGAGESTYRGFRYTHTDLLPGEYADSIKFITNDPLQPVVYAPYTITVDDPYIEPEDYKENPFEIITESISVTIPRNDTITVPLAVRNNSDLPRKIYFPVPMEYPDEYKAFYNAKKSLNFDWQDISETGTKLELGDDDFQSIQLPFSLYMGSGYYSDYITISSNGYLVRGQADASSSINVPMDMYLASEHSNMLAAYWDDLVTDEWSGIYYSISEHKLIVQYDNVLIYGTTARNTFQIIIEGSDIKYQYLSMHDQFSASIGLSPGPTSGSYPIPVSANEPFVSDSLVVLFQTTTASFYDEEVGIDFYVMTPNVIYPPALTVPPHTTLDIPLQVWDTGADVVKTNITLLSFDMSPYNYPGSYVQVDPDALVVPLTITTLDNATPVIHVEDVTVIEGTTQDITFTATDDDSLVFITVENAPSFMTLKSASDKSASYTIAPLLVHVGEYTVIVKATDSFGQEGSDTLHLSVVRYAVTSFSMINTETGEVLFDFNDGVTVNQSDPDFSVMTIRANTSPEIVGSVKFKVDGAQVNIDNTNPYQLKNRHILSLSPGAHTVFAEPFTEKSGHANRGESKQATVTVIHATNVVMDFSLVNIVTGEVISNFDNTITIDRSRPDFMNLNIRANTLPSAVGSVKFKVNGTQRNIDSQNPYLLKSGFLISLNPGNYTLVAEPFTGANGHGERGQGKTVVVTLKPASAVVTDFSLVNVVTNEVISHFTNSIIINRNRPDLGDLTIRANTGTSETLSVKFKVNGTQRNIDSSNPYWLKKQLLQTLMTGENILVAEPYTEANGHGERGELREATIILDDLPLTVSFSLVNVTTGQVLETFDQHLTLDRTRSDFANLNIKANTIPAVVGSVKFKINGAQRNIDSNAPYMLSNQSLQSLALGNTQLYGEPFTQSNGHGSHGQFLEATVSLVQGATAAMKATARIEEGSSEKVVISIYPVPVADIVRFKTNEYDSRTYQLALINVMGQTVYKGYVASGTLNGFELSTNSIGLGSGVYYIHLVDGNGARVIKKLIKQ